MTKDQMIETALQKAADVSLGYLNKNEAEMVKVAIASIFEDISKEARYHSIGLKQCSIFAQDAGKYIAKSMTDAAEFLDRLV